MGRSIWSGYEGERPRIDAIIQKLREEGKPWLDVAAALNEKALRTKSGMEWTGPVASSYGIAHRLAKRVRDTKVGAAGSTGAPRYSKRNGRKMRRIAGHVQGECVKANHPTERELPISNSGSFIITAQEWEDILTSNLATSLKFKIVRIAVATNP